ncbi:MAG: NAD(P)H-binding protein, partial [Actinomycetota bacterium]|nr:NAD(P)H-binding protein [Actinomycetota bacterium]
MILVVGATGTTGREVVRELVAAGAPVRGLTRSEERAEALRGLGAQAAVGDLGDPLSLMPALRGVERMYVATPVSEGQAELESNAFAAAEQAGVYHVVKLGVITQGPASPLRFGRVHSEAAEALTSSSLRWTLLLASGFMQGLRATDGRYASSLGDARVAWVDARDVAAVAARALVQEGHENCSYTLTGPEALSGDEVAASLGAEHVRVSDEEAVAPLRSGGASEWRVEGLVELWRDVYRAGLAATPTPDVEAVLGRPARSLRD